MDTKEFLSELALEEHKDDVVTLGTLMNCLNTLTEEIVKALTASNEYTDTRVDGLTKFVKKVNDEYIKKRMDMDLMFVMSYIKGSNNKWMQDYEKVAKAVFKE